jgi:hypothetical protein
VLLGQRTHPTYLCKYETKKQKVKLKKHKKVIIKQNLESPKSATLIIKASVTKQFLAAKSYRKKKMSKCQNKTSKQKK